MWEDDRNGAWLGATNDALASLPELVGGRVVLAESSELEAVAAHGNPPLETTKTASERCATLSFWFAVASIAWPFWTYSFPFWTTGPLCALIATVLGIVGLTSQKWIAAISGLILAGLSLILFSYMTNLQTELRRPMR